MNTRRQFLIQAPLGLIGAVEFVAEKNPPRAFDPAAKVGPRIARRGLELGLLTRALPAAAPIAFSPPAGGSPHGAWITG